MTRIDHDRRTWKLYPVTISARSRSQGDQRRLAGRDVSRISVRSGSLHVQEQHSTHWCFSRCAVEAGATEALADWLAVRGEAAGPLFVRMAVFA